MFKHPGRGGEGVAGGCREQGSEEDHGAAGREGRGTRWDAIDLIIC